MERGEVVTDEEWKKFLEGVVIQMRLEHRLFMQEACRRFFFGLSVCAGLYLGLQAVVYLIFGKVTWP